MAYTGSKLYSLILKQQNQITQQPKGGRKLVVQTGTSDRSRHAVLDHQFMNNYHQNFQTDNPSINYPIDGNKSEHADHFQTSRNSKARALSQIRIGQKGGSRAGSNLRNANAAYSRPNVVPTSSTKQRVKATKKFNLKVNQPGSGVQALLQTYNSAFSSKTPSKQIPKTNTLNYTTNEYTNNYLHSELLQGTPSKVNPPIQQNFNNINVFNEYNINGKTYLGKNKTIVQHQNFFTIDSSDIPSKLSGMRSNSVNRRAGNQTISNIRDNLIKSKQTKRDMTPDPTSINVVRQLQPNLTIRQGEMKLKNPSEQRNRNIPQAKQKLNTEYIGKLLQKKKENKDIIVQDESTSSMPLIIDDRSSYRESARQHQPKHGQVIVAGSRSEEDECSGREDYDDFETVESQLALYDLDDSNQQSQSDRSRYDCSIGLRNSRKNNVELRQRAPLSKISRTINLSKPTISNYKSKEMSEHLLQMVSNQDLDKMKELIHKSIQQRSEPFKGSS